MDKFLDMFAKLLPLIAFYPKAIQLLFLITFVLALVSLGAFVLFYASASEQQRTGEAARIIPAEIRQGMDRDLASLAITTADLGSAMSNYYAAAVALRVHLLHYTDANPNVKAYADTSLPDELRRDVDTLIQRLHGMEAALNAINQNALVSACWRRAAQGMEGGALRDIQVRMMERGFSRAESTVDVSDLPSLVPLFTTTANRLREYTFRRLIEAVLNTNMAQNPGIGLGYDHAALRSLVFSGNLIFPLLTQSKIPPHQYFIASWGTAILRDLYFATPDAKVIRAELLERYPKHSVAIQSDPLSNYRAPAVSQDLVLAIEALEKRRAILFFDIP